MKIILRHKTNFQNEENHRTGFAMPSTWFFSSNRGISKDRDAQLEGWLANPLAKAREFNSPPTKMAGDAQEHGRSVFYLTP